MATAVNRQGSASNNIFNHHIVVEGDGYIAIAADASVIANTTSIVAGRNGLREPDAGKSWCDLGTIAKNGTGQYEITLEQQYCRLLSAVPILSVNGTANFRVVMGTDNVRLSTAKGSQKLIFIIVNSSGAAADPNVALGIRFHARFKK